MSSEIYEDLKQRIQILKETQEMITKEIWRKKQLLKIMYTNKAFSKQNQSPVRSHGHNFDPEFDNYNRGMCRTEHMDPEDDFAYTSQRPNGRVTNITGTKRGVSITKEMYSRSIKDAANELDKLKRDVENIEDKIINSSDFFEKCHFQFEESQMIYEDKKATMDDLNLFKQ
jgi:hypothetical protein